MDWNQVAAICLVNFVLFFLMTMTITNKTDKLISKIEILNSNISVSAERIENILKKIHGN